MIDTTAIRAAHVRVGGDPLEGPPWCDHCEGTYPCDAIQLCDEVDRLREENEQAREWMDHSPHCPADYASVQTCACGLRDWLRGQSLATARTPPGEESASAPATGGKPRT